MFATYFLFFVPFLIRPDRNGQFYWSFQRSTSWFYLTVLLVFIFSSYLSAFKIFSLLLIFSRFSAICPDVVFFIFILFQIYGTFGICDLSFVLFCFSQFGNILGYSLFKYCFSPIPFFFPFCGCNMFFLKL